MIVFHEATGLGGAPPASVLALADGLADGLVGAGVGEYVVGAGAGVVVVGRGLGVADFFGVGLAEGDLLGVLE